MFDECGVAADLSKFEKGVEEDDLCLLAGFGGEGAADVFVHGGSDGFVEIFFGFGEFDVVGDFCFGWEFGGDLIFGASEDEWADFGSQCVGAFLVFVFFDRVAECFAERFGVAEEFRHEEVEEAPEFAEVVFDGCAGEADAVSGVELAGSLGDLGGRVFDVLGFVENQ